jgi:hypothetical protein
MTLDNRNIVQYMVVVLSRSSFDMTIIMTTISKEFNSQKQEFCLVHELCKSIFKNC